MVLTSPSFENEGMIPTKFTCEGGNMNPELQVQNVPEDAKSLALILHDPDAPIAGGFTHWVVWNISPKTMVIKEESTPPKSVEGRNGGGRTGYTGPCPPLGTHRYEFYLYALNDMLDLPTTAGRQELEDAMEEHIVAKTMLVGTYRKQGKK